MSSPVSASKALSDKDFRQNLRIRSIAAREALTPVEHARRSAALCRQLAPLIESLPVLCLGFCWPYRGEADLRPLVADWLAGDASRSAALPRVAGRAAPLEFVRWYPGAPMAADAYGIPVPAGAPGCKPDLLLIPLNAFDAAGFRIGYGAGYFDRTLAALAPRPRTIGVGFELGRVASIRPEPHDRPLDWIVTEAGAFPACSPEDIVRD